jgi:catechol 2,3-dioxygenase-like lactoylglutathione lyase family enzyme
MMSERTESAGDGAGSGTGTGISVLGVDHLNLRVADLERSLRFYQGLLGMREAQRDRRPDGRVSLIAMRAGNAVVFLQPAPDYRPPEDWGRSGLDHFSLEIEAQDAAALAARLREAGVEVLEGPVQRWGAHGEGTSVYVRDPDGHHLELKQYNLG